MGDIVYPELSYAIIGAAFRVFNNTGYGMGEKFYQQAFAKELEISQIGFEKERMVEIIYNGEAIGKYFLDFVVDGKVIVEMKVQPRLGYVHIKQVMGYLKTTGHKLAILIYFTRDGVRYRRVLNAF